MFADAVHPTHAVQVTSGRKRMNIHGAIDLETGQTRIREECNATCSWTTPAITPSLRDWLAQPERRIKLQLSAFELRASVLMHRNVTHNRCYFQRRRMLGFRMFPNDLCDDEPGSPKDT